MVIHDLVNKDVMSQQSPPNPIGRENAFINQQLRDKRSLKSYIYALIAFKKDRNKNHSETILGEDMKKQFQDQSDDDTPRTVG